MNILIIGSSEAAPSEKERHYYESYVTFFRESTAAIEGEVRVATALFDDLLMDVGEGTFAITDVKNNVPLHEYDVLFLRGDKFRANIDILGTISAYARQHTIPVINEIETGRVASKLLQAVQFEQLGVPVARTLCVNTALLEHFSSIQDWKFPCIMKARFGSHGNNNYVVSSLEEINVKLQDDPSVSYVLQRFIANDGDYRILLVGRETLVIGRSAAGGSHLNNTSQGGDATRVDAAALPEGLLDDARSIVDFYHMTIAGVDAIVSRETGAYYFLEVNAQPQLMTGAFVEDKKRMIGALIDELRSGR